MRVRYKYITVMPSQQSEHKLGDGFHIFTRIKGSFRNTNHWNRINSVLGPEQTANTFYNMIYCIMNLKLLSSQ